MFKAKNNTKDGTAPKSRRINTDGIIGLMLLFVVMSIAYSSYTVWFGEPGIVPKALLAPQLLFAAFTLVRKFNK